ncbi:MAG: M28 family metallopeptidase [Candidatus Ranarchaeia archaeon]
MGFKRGSIFPEKLIIVSAHLDSISAFINASPGSDNNLSGISIVNALACSLIELNNSVSLMYVGWAGEEEGLYGSRKWIEENYNDYDIGCIINLDMLGFGNGVSLYSNKFSIDFTEMYQKILADNGISVRIYQTETFRASDHWSFWQNLIPAMTINEQNWTPFYHSPLDLPRTLNLTQLSLVAESTLSFIQNISTDYVLDFDIEWPKYLLSGITHVLAINVNSKINITNLKLRVVSDLALILPEEITITNLSSKHPTQFNISIPIPNSFTNTSIKLSILIINQSGSWDFVSKPIAIDSIFSRQLVILSSFSLSLIVISILFFHTKRKKNILSS